MESDGLYRFVALRSLQLTTGDAPRDPFINAYGKADRTALFRRVEQALGDNDPVQARVLCSGFVADLGLTDHDPWMLAAGSPLREVCAKLATLARRGSAEQAEKLTSGHANVAPAGLRSRLADLYLCQAMLTGTNIPADATAQIILCLETIERLSAPDVGGHRAPRRLAWRIPLTRGQMYLPLKLQRLQPVAPAESGRGRLGAYLSPRAIIEGAYLRLDLKPPRQWMGDLILLRQKVRGYSLGEIAHVENVLLKESFKRTFRTTNKTEQTLLTETDTTRESERDLQTTTRDELRTEIQKAQSEDLALAVNFNVQASFNGGTYSVVAGAGGSASYRRASEEREDTSIGHAREVVDKAVERVSERVHTIQQAMTSHEEEDITEHGLENKDGKDHIVGVYRWLEKRVDLHLINYGRRLIYEVMIPEPATFWRRLVAQRGNGAAGEPPAYPALSQGEAHIDLAPGDFGLRNGNALLSEPARWSEIQRLAGNWGVQLEDPPPVNVQASLSFYVEGDKQNADAEKAIHMFEKSDGSLAFYGSPYVVSGGPTEKLKVPAGYLATTGAISLKGWMFVKTSGDHYQFESGSAVVLIGGEKFGFTEGTPAAPNETGVTGNTWTLDTTLLLQNPLSGDQTIVVTTNLNGVGGTIWLNCLRMPELEAAWARKMYGLFAAAYQAQYNAYQDALTRAALQSATWAGSLPSATCREIEKRELKRGVLTQFTLGGLELMGDSVLGEPADGSPTPKEPILKPLAIDAYASEVAFFEQVFDWSNMAYIFAPYMYGRRSEWASLGVASDADAQFKAFLSAGAARVQVPVRPGYEPHAEYFFLRLGRYPLDQRIPWLGPMHSIAEDLAAQAREGFTVGLGSLAVTQGSTNVKVSGSEFKDPDDVSRELRFAGGLYIIAAVVASDEVELTRAFTGATAAALPYETGGIVVGPPIELTLPTTLVAIDKEDLRLPTFPGRYV